MKTNKRLQGFTLVELIIVMAIFGIIMLGVMKIADPLAKVMNRSSTKEKSAAYVDNISDYLDKSMRYAKYMRVYEGEFGDYKDSKGNTMTEEAIAKDFVDTYYDGCIYNDGENVGLMKGKLHIMKLINTSSYGGGEGIAPTQITVKKTKDDVVNASDGEIWDTVYSFTCGDSYQKSDNKLDIGWKVDAKVKLEGSQMVINPEHLSNYGYYYSYGYSRFDVVSHDPDEVEGDAGAKNVSYSVLKPDDTVSGSSRFAISIVAYPEGNKMKAVADGSTWFKSPSYMNTMSMYLINAENAEKKQTDVMQTQDKSGNPVEDKVEQVVIKDNAFFKYSPTGVAPSTDNLYFVYVVPSELYLT